MNHDVTVDAREVDFYTGMADSWYLSDLKFIGAPLCSCHYPTMTAFLTIPIVLSLVALGAHFLRFGNELGVIVSILLIGLLFLRRAWVARLVQVALVLGTIEWLWTMYSLLQIRTAQGAPATRMVLILGGVALVAFASALLFQTKRLKRAYRQGGFL